MSSNSPDIPRHKVFVSYHHANDQKYRDEFEKLFANVHQIMVTRSVQIGDIDTTNMKVEALRQKIREEYIRDATVCVVLVGAQTWQRKHVDWEIAASIRATSSSERAGLLGIILPTYPRKDPKHYDPQTIPPRLANNLDCKYASLHNWSGDPQQVAKWIHDAYARRKDPKLNPDNSFVHFADNRSGDRWTL